jgi:hypothetical protein
MQDHDVRQLVEGMNVELRRLIIQYNLCMGRSRAESKPLKVTTHCRSTEGGT